MRIFLLLSICMWHCSVQAQDPSTFISDNQDIPALEMKRFRPQPASSGANLKTAAGDNCDIKYYRCEWEVDPSVRYVKGKVTAHFKTVLAGNSVTFDLSNALTVNAVMQGAVPLAFTHQNDLVNITLPAFVAGKLDSVSIVYEGVPASGGLGSFETSIHGISPAAAPVLWTLSEPFGSRDWWPCKNGLDDKADSVDIFITHPASYKSVSNGLRISQLPVNGGKTKTHWKHRYPIASYLICMAVTNYHEINDQVVLGGSAIPVQTFCFPESEAGFQAGAQNALSALVFYSNLFGTYPFKNEKYGHAQFGWGGGMEHQTCSFMTNMSESLVVHELAHQWFGDKITCASWEDIWLNEGFATFLASLYMENKYPETAISGRKSRVDNITSQPGGSVRVDDPTNTNRIFSNRLSYNKGSYLLYMLRWILGDAVFFQSLQNYLSDPALAFGFATTADLRTHFEAVAGKDLGYFFDQWYTGQGYPSYQLGWYASGNTVQIKLGQTTSHPSVGFFKLPVPVRFRNSVSGEEKLVVLDHIASGQFFTASLGFTPDEVSIDPEVRLVSANNIVTKMSAPLPVIFSAFRVDCADGFPSLSWETSREHHAGSFFIEKSSDGFHWSDIENIQAVGESTGKQSYTFIDYFASTSYYRIREEDPDGKTMHSAIRYADCESDEARLVIMPNPVADQLLVKYDYEKAGPLTAMVFDQAGRLVGQYKVSGAQRGAASIDLFLLPAGVFIIKMIDSQGNEYDRKRFVKK